MARFESVSLSIFRYPDLLFLTFIAPIGNGVRALPFPYLLPLSPSVTSVSKKSFSDSILKNFGVRSMNFCFRWRRDFRGSRESSWVSSSVIFWSRKEFWCRKKPGRVIGGGAFRGVWALCEFGCLAERRSPCFCRIRALCRLVLLRPAFFLTSLPSNFCLLTPPPLSTSTSLSATNFV